jgi:hypothetical protein
VTDPVDQAIKTAQGAVPASQIATLRMTLPSGVGVVVVVPITLSDSDLVSLMMNIPVALTQARRQASDPILLARGTLPKPQFVRPRR